MKIISDMKYFKVIWIHENLYDEILAYHEIDMHRMEKRKIHIMWDSSIRYASESKAVGDIELSWEPIPPFSELQSLKEFVVFQISQEEFETVWQKVINKA